MGGYGRRRRRFEPPRAPEIVARRGPIGVLLAGGEGRRLGGDKPRVELQGRPLAVYALEALTGALDEVVVACRLDTDLPLLHGVREAWVEPDGPRGAVAGIVSSLREARGRSIVTCAVTLPLMLPEIVRAVATAPAAGRLAVVPCLGGRLEPLLARWEPDALPVLEGLPADMPLQRAAGMLDPATVELTGDDDAFLRVEAPEDLLRAGAVLDARRRARALV